MKSKHSKSTPGWKGYQNEAAEFFRSLGLEAKTDASIRGVRTSHDVDVVVKSHHAGFEVTWVVECKKWKSRISKLHVLALREIVADVGADRGVLLAEGGFQSGAAEAAALTNVHITSIADLRSTASAEIYSMRLRELYDRIEAARVTYWDIPKPRRIECGLRFDVGGPLAYSGARIIDLVDDLLIKAFRGVYPIQPDEILRCSFAPNLPSAFTSVGALVTGVEPLVKELEKKLRECIRLTHATG